MQRVTWTDATVRARRGRGRLGRSAVALAALLVGASCLGTNPADDDLAAAKARAPDKGRTAVDPIVEGALTLTFDDGPGPYTKDIVDALSERGIRATFFVVGRNIPGHRDVLEYTRSRGHQIANHSYNHDLQTLLTETQFKHGVLGVLRNIDGADGGRHYFRFPFGAAGDEQLRWLSEIDAGGRRYRPVGWHLDSHDFEYGTGFAGGEERSATVLDGEGPCGDQANPFADDMLGWTQFIARKKKGGVMLFHDTQPITHAKIEAVLSAFVSPEAYWAALPPEQQATYGRFYDCAGVDRHFRFSFRALDDGTYPSLAYDR